MLEQTANISKEPLVPLELKGTRDRFVYHDERHDIPSTNRHKGFVDQLRKILSQSGGGMLPRATEKSAEVVAVHENFTLSNSFSVLGNSEINLEVTSARKRRPSDDSNASNRSSHMRER